MGQCKSELLSKVEGHLYRCLRDDGHEGEHRFTQHHEVLAMNAAYERGRLMGIEQAAALLDDRYDQEFSNPHAVDWSLAKAAQNIRALAKTEPK